MRDEVSRFHAHLVAEAARADSDQDLAAVEGHIAVLELVRSDIAAAGEPFEAPERLSA